MGTSLRLDLDLLPLPERTPARARPAPVAEPRISKRQFGKRLRYAAERQGLLTRQARADYLGVTLKSMRAYERGRYAPHLFSAVQMARKLGVTVEWLVWGEAQPPTLPGERQGPNR